MKKATFKIHGMSKDKIYSLKCNTENLPRKILTKRFIENPNPDLWGQYPFLPLTRSKGNGSLPELGFILAGNPKKVFLGNIFLNFAPVTLEKIMTLGNESFNSIDDLLSAGWEVD